MKRSKFTDEQILAILKEGEAGRRVADLCRSHGITQQTYYRWKAKYGGMVLRDPHFLSVKVTSIVTSTGTGLPARLEANATCQNRRVTRGARQS